jgi:hypothetical protein
MMEITIKKLREARKHSGIQRVRTWNRQKIRRPTSREERYPKFIMAANRTLLMAVIKSKPKIIKE